MCCVIASQAKDPRFYSRCPHNRQNWWHSHVTQLLGDKDLEWLEEFFNLASGNGIILMLTLSWGFVIQLVMWYPYNPDYQSVIAQEP